MSVFHAKHALVGTIALNVLNFHYLQNRSHINHEHIFTVQNGTLRSMLFSMFSHVDANHLWSNMLGLLIYGRQFFRVSSHEQPVIWQNPFCFLLLYLGSGLGGFLGVSLVSQWHERQWQSKLHKNRQSLAQTLSTWLWWNPIRADSAPGGWSRIMADTFTYVTHLNGAANKFLYSNIPRIGASGAVYGILGARLLSSLEQQQHDEQATIHPTEAIYFLLQMADELAQCPLQLDNAATFWIDNVDHVAHAAGFFTGIILALVFSRLYVAGTTCWSFMSSQCRRRHVR